MNWDKLDEFIASGYRPIIAIACGFAVAACCFIPATAMEALPLAATLAGGTAVLRTLDKKTATSAVTPQPVSVGKTG